MAFRFRLEKVLRHRRRLVDIRGREVAEAAAGVAALERQIATCRQAQNDAADHATGDLQITERRLCAEWITHLEGRVENLAARRREAAAALANRRLELQQAWRDREVLERLRQRHLAEWRTEQNRRERAELDEIGQQRAWPGRRTHSAAPVEEVAEKFGTDPGTDSKPEV